MDTLYTNTGQTNRSTSIRTVTTALILASLTSGLGADARTSAPHRPLPEEPIASQALPERSPTVSGKSAPAADDAATLEASFLEFQNRWQKETYQRHLIAGYLRESGGIVQRLIAAIKEDSKQGGDSFDVNRQVNECRMLLASLTEELNLIDLNHALETQQNKKTVNIRDFGAKGDDKQDDAPAMRQAVEKARALGDGARIFIPRGRYLFDETLEGRHISFIDLTNLTVEAEPGALLVMKHPGPGLYVERCKNLRFLNLALDCDPLPFTQGTIVAVDKTQGTFDLRIQDGYPDPSTPVFTRAGRLRGLVREPGTGLIDLACGDPRIRKVEMIGENLYRLQPIDNQGVATAGLVRNFEPGKAFVLNARQTRGAGAMVTAVRSEYVNFENCRVYASYDHVFFGKCCTALKFIHCTVDRLPGSTRIGVNNADGIHLQSQKIGPYIEGTRIHWVNDDCFNSYGLWDVLVRSESQDTFTIATHEPENYQPGDNVVIINPNTGLLAGCATVIESRPAVWRGLGCVQIRLDRSLAGIATVESLGKKSIKARRPMRNEGETEFFICNLYLKGDGYVIQNCDFGFNRASGMKIKAPNGIVQHVALRRHQLAAVLIKIDLGWREGFYPHNVIVRDNTLINAHGVRVALVLPGFKAIPADNIYRRLVVENNREEKDVKAEP